MDPSTRLLSMGAAGASGPAVYVEDVFSTWLYTGNGSTQTITNGIDLSGKGGLVWIKGRAASTHRLIDTVRGATKRLETNATTAEATDSSGLTAFNSDGFTLGSGGDYNDITKNFASWTFRKAAKFFDVVTYTGNGSNRTVAHNLGSVPGCIIVKRTDAPDIWAVYHRSTGNTGRLALNETSAFLTTSGVWNNTDPTSAVFTVGTGAPVNASGGTYVAYLFAHDTSTDGLIQCGSFTTDGSGAATVSLGWEPQWVLVKQSSAESTWLLLDSMRGWAASYDNVLQANLSNAEVVGLIDYGEPTATGFNFKWSASASCVYIAIRRGPMKTPTDATKVFSAITSSASSGTKLTTDFVVDAQISSWLSNSSASANRAVNDRMRGVSTNSSDTRIRLNTAAADAEAATGAGSLFWDNTGFQFPVFSSGLLSVFYNFRRAPGFFDVVAYTGTGSATTISHNLGVAPELMIVKRRDTTADWQVYAGVSGEYLVLNTTAAKVTSNTDRWNNTVPTSTVFSLGTNAVVNANAGTYIAYLFASCPGVSKVGSYTGTGTTKQIDCGFTAGARFVLIKRTDSTGDWYVWDTARGIVSGNDPYLLLNSTAAEVTNTDYIDPLNSGFEISSTAPAAINASGGSFIFLAIA